MKIKLLLLLCCGLWGSCSSYDYCPVTPSESDLVFTGLARSWDEAMPLGNATVGALVWQRDSSLRLSLDRTDLWDLRPVDSLSGDNFRFSWVKEHIRTKDYLPVQKKLDWPYNMNPAPSKIPGAAIEFPLEKIGAPTQVRLYLNNALCEANWADGTQMQTFVHATEPVGWFVFRNLRTPIEPSILTPVYNKTKPDGSLDPVSGQDLHRLGYQQGETVREGNRITYHQKGYGDFWYDVVVCWKQEGETLYGTWSVTSSLSGEKAAEKAEAALQRGLKQDYQAHLEYWNKYWAQSSVTLPDSILQKQYQNEMYKFASTTREHSYPISLQAVWTADNGKLPPWKGDYHHDLNTQLSYWPAYTGNHLTEGMGYLNTLWNQRDTYKRYTRQYFGTEGMNIPGVCTLTGEPMGGWIQYSMSQTVAAWLAQHFYLHWKYSADRTFLKERAYPFLKDVAIYLEQVSEVTPEGVRKLEFSSSPEVFDNSMQAWFSDMTNYDLAMMHFLFKAAAELAHELNLTDESSHWAALEAQLPDYDVDEEGCLTFAKGYPYNESHRHFSHAMAIHPMGLIDWSDGEKSQHIIRATLKRLDEVGPDYWTGYSYSWLANMKARAFDGKGAAQALRTFAECFCLKNTFHANGDQTKSGKSRFTYRPFTLEGNFAFASGIQEMLLQSHTGTIRIFPALPEEWKDVSFEGLRAMGAFLVSAQMEGGEITRVRIYSEKGGMLKIARPGTLKPDKNYTLSGPDILNIDTQAGEWIELKP
ncbi:glycoside hydrolase family 95-like protein [Bacteroides hominis]|uniref:glycosyl hydrolase family 95 catalytic domain-containing protein n=1 Tax=Bacteroides hominis TaxID=2763023 RepID=UPI0039C4A6E5